MRFQPYFSDWLARLYLSGVWLLVLAGSALAVGLYSWVVWSDDPPIVRGPEPAECRWMEIEQPGQWEQTCDPDQKRKF